MAGRKVYVVDDEEAIRRSACLLLKVWGYDPTPFESGSALLNVAEALIPGCILLDIRMPESDGIEVQRALAELGSVHPVVIMTGHGDVQAALAALDGGAVAFIEKPFSKTRLLETLDLAFLKLEAPDAYRTRLQQASEQVAGLGEDEQAVLACLADGRSAEEMAAALGLRAGDLEIRRARLFEQLGVAGTTGALNIAFAARLARQLG